MIAWTGFLACVTVALAAPQLDLGAQVVGQSQLLNAQPIRTEYLGSQQQQLVNAQPIRTEFVSSQPQILTSQPQFLSAGPQALRTTQFVNTQSLPINYQSVPVNTYNYQQLPVQTVRVSQPTSFAAQPFLRTNTISAQPIVRTNLLASQPIVRTNLVASQPIVHSNYVASQPIVQSNYVASQPIVRSNVVAAQPLVRTSAIAAQPFVHTSTIAPQPIVRPVIQTSTLAPPVVKANFAPLAVQQRVVPQLEQRYVSNPSANYAILRQVQDVQADGSYGYAFETENGIKFQEEGRILNQGSDDETAAVQGSYSYQSPEGLPITVNYIADGNGFRAEGEHIPKPSEAILRSLEYLRSLPPRPEDNEGKYVKDANGY